MARLFHVSRPTVYRIIRGEVVIHLAAPGRKGIILVPESTLRRLLEKFRKRFR